METKSQKNQENEDVQRIPTDCGNYKFVSRGELRDFDQSPNITTQREVKIEVGDSAVVSADHGSEVATGRWSRVMVGMLGKVSVEDHSSVIAGERSIVHAGDNCSVSAREGADLICAGNRCVVNAGDSSDVRCGEYCRVFAADGSVVSAGLGTMILFSLPDYAEVRQPDRYVVVGENGIEPGKRYCLTEAGEVVEASMSARAQSFESDKEYEKEGN